MRLGIFGAVRSASRIPIGYYPGYSQQESLFWLMEHLREWHRRLVRAQSSVHITLDPP